MKKFIVIILFCFVVIPCTMKAQLFERDESFKTEGSKGNDPHGGSGGSGSDPAPIGSGLLVLTGLSLGYACFKQRCKED